MSPRMNAWSLLYEELKMSENFEDRYEDGIKSKHYYEYDRNDINRANPFSSVSEASSEDYQSFWGAGDYILAGMSGSDSSDTISFGAAQAAQSTPTVVGGQDVISFDFNPPAARPSSTNNRRKYDEDVIIKELQEYIGRTYQQHYSAGSDKIQTLDLIEACGDGEAFCRSNILKYASRYDKKGTARRDIMKILHYAVLLMHFNDKNANRETYPQ